MPEILSMMGRHGYAFTFVLLFAEAVGLPFPAAIALVASGAAVAAHTLGGPAVLATAVTALLLGDTLQFFLGRHMGWALLGFLCRVSVNPETCILRSAESFYKRGRSTLLFAKFIPGVNTMAPPLAGSMKMPLAQFLGLDFAGAALYALAYGGVGFIFGNFLVAITRGFRAASHIAELAAIAAAIAFVAYRVWLYRKYRIYRIVPRVQVMELARELQSEEAGKILLVDVRSHGYYDPGATRIRGSIRIEPNNLSKEVQTLPKDKDIYLYCT